MTVRLSSRLSHKGDTGHCADIAPKHAARERRALCSQAQLCSQARPSASRVGLACAAAGLQRGMQALQVHLPACPGELA
jgi:hypothetical protein